MLSPIRRLCHWGPIASVAVVVSVTIATISANMSLLLCLVYQLSMCLTLYNMWCAALLGPGYLDPNEDNPPDSGRFCRKCALIVAKKHHHCSWINNCVGQNNEHYFKRFLLFAAVVAIESCVILSLDTYHRYLVNTFLLFNLFNLGLAFGVLLAASVLLYIH
uniref:Palmitoyltransferase n=1 Tax=Aceria tosichella TaxID=561515 RepID=A0A6G1SBL2_9ACAR